MITPDSPSRQALVALPPHKPTELRFPVVGIGASAGGLEALNLFLAQVPADSGMAFIVVQHLAPDHKSALPELLQRVTVMNVLEASNGMMVKPNCVYVSPPNKNIAIAHGKLLLQDMGQPHSQPWVIDFFFQSLAEDQQKNAVAVILSGMGTDGTLGLRAIKFQDGLTAAQEPTTAKFDSMPRSAISAGLADLVDLVEALPERIIRYRQNLLNSQHDTGSNSSIDKIIAQLHAHTGNDFSLYKKTTLYRRIERRMGLHQIAKMNTYVDFLRDNPQEKDMLFKELLIGVTRFFRDAEVWIYLKTEVLPALLAKASNGQEFRAWVPACSTGEEAYSLAIIFAEVLAQTRPNDGITLKIFATDLDPDAITFARQGLYSRMASQDLSPERMERYFVAEDQGLRVVKKIREMILFAPHNLSMNAPFTRLDILTCRNVLIYLGRTLQNMLLPLFHYALKTDGILLLGNAETIGNFGELFDPIESKLRLYRRIPAQSPSVARSLALTFPPKPRMTQEKNTMMSSPVTIQHLVDQFLLKHYSPAAVLINVEGDILYINGSTGHYLEPPAGKTNWNIHAMSREGLHFPLMQAVKKAVREQVPVTVEDIKVGTNGGVRQVNITVQALGSSEEPADKVIVIFTHPVDVASKVGTLKRVITSRHDARVNDIEHARMELQSLREQMQISQEELQSTNEELQSANEELTTSQEEMQSMNEELQTVNAELQSKVDDLSLVNNDMLNLLNSTEIATVFLDNALRVRRFTPHTTRLFKLLPSDVGRSLSDIVSDLDYPTLSTDAQHVLTTLVFTEKPITTHDGRWFTVRIMPYRTHDNIINGVVITFLDITAAKKLEAVLRQTSNPEP